MKTYEVQIEQIVRVTIDETKFTPEFMKAFSDSMYDFETIEEHVKNLAEWRARGVIQSDRDFHEGYGHLNEFGITTFVKDTDVYEPEEVKPTSKHTAA